MKTIKDAQKHIGRLPPDPAQKPLTKLIEWIVDNDPRWIDYTEERIFLAAYGEQKAAADAYKKALKTADDQCVRSFCLASTERTVRLLARKPPSDPAA